MRTPRRVKQPLVYALLMGKQQEYKRDEQGNIIYRLVHGEQVPLKGELVDVYSSPIPFYNSISATLSEDEMQAYGAMTNIIAKMTYKREQYPFKTGTLIWKTSEVKLLDDGSPDPLSADYRVVGVMNEGQYFWKCLLEAVTKNEAENNP